MKIGEKFHRFPHEVRQMPEADYQFALMVWQAEANANELKGNQRKHYRK